jgi:hypothetical protein
VVLTFGRPEIQFFLQFLQLVLGRASRPGEDAGEKAAPTVAAACKAAP